MKSSEAIRRIADQIEKTLDDHPFADMNPVALRTLKGLAAQLAGYSQYSGPVAAALLERAAVFYSVRKHERVYGGASRVYEEMRLELLPRIREDAKRFENAGN